MIEITRLEDLPALVVALRSRVAELERSLNHHREDLDLRVAELRLWLKRHGVTEPALTEFWNIVANKRPQGSISDPDDPNDLGLSLSQRNERLEARADRYLAAITEYVQATAAEEQAEEAYASFGRRILTLPPVTEADVDAAHTTVATARNRAYAATAAIRAITEEVKP